MHSSNQAQKPKFSVAIATPSYQKLINNTLGDPERAKRFVATITSAVAVNPALQNCECGSILAGALLGESLNLSPSPQLGQFYLVPFECRAKGPDGKAIWVLDEVGNPKKDDKGKWIPVTECKAQFVLGYKGYIQLALRSGYYADLDTIEIREGEYLGKDPSTGKPRFRFVEDDDERETLSVIGYMAYFEYLNGFKKCIYWSKQKMQAHADKYSPAYSAAAHQKILDGKVPDSEMWKYSSYWYKNFDDMAKKTMLRQLISRWGVMSTELQTAFDGDSKMMAVDDSGNFIPTDDEPPAIIAPGTALQPEATDVVEKVDLSTL